MNKIAIPALLVATIMVAGAFAFMPVQQASTVHDSITDAVNGVGFYSDSTALTAANGSTDTNIYTMTVDEPVILLGIEVTADCSNLQDAGDIIDATVSSRDGGGDAISSDVEICNGTEGELTEFVLITDSLTVAETLTVEIVLTESGSNDNGDSGPVTVRFWVEGNGGTLGPIVVT